MLFSSKKKFDFYQLQKFLTKSRGILPAAREWPEQISLTPDVWDSITKIKDYTKQEGRERSTSLFIANGDIVTTPYVRGRQSRVSSKHVVTLKYEPTHRTNWYEKIILLDGNVYKRYTVAKDKIPSKPEVNYLFNIHTHPPHKTESGEIYYNHISETDLKGLLASNALCMGLAIDKFWLVCKTNTVGAQIDFELLQSITGRFTVNESGKSQKIKQVLLEAGLVIYHAKYGGKMILL